MKRNVSRAPLVGNVAYDILHGIKIGLKDVLAPQGMFADLGLKYVGPIDAHDIPAVERALQQAKQFRGPVMVHCITRKGNGFKAAENHEEDRFHAVGKINAKTGEAVGVPRADLDRPVLRGAFCSWGSADERVVAITAAMVYPTGLHRFAKAFPDRCFDVGIAEQHAVTSAAVWRWVVCTRSFACTRPSSTALSTSSDGCRSARMRGDFRARQGRITGPDGASHHGMWDMSILQVVPGRIWRRRGRQPLTRRAGAILGHRRPPLASYASPGARCPRTFQHRPAGLDGQLLRTEQPRVLVMGSGRSRKRPSLWGSGYLTRGSV